MLRSIRPLPVHLADSSPWTLSHPKCWQGLLTLRCDISEAYSCLQVLVWTSSWTRLTSLSTLRKKKKNIWFMEIKIKVCFNESVWAPLFSFYRVPYTYIYIDSPNQKGQVSSFKTMLWAAHNSTLENHEFNPLLSF